MYTIYHKHLDPLVTFNILDYKAYVANKITDLQSNSWKMKIGNSIIQFILNINNNILILTL